MMYQVIVEDQSWHYYWSELGSKWSGDWDVSQVSQVGIKIVKDGQGWMNVKLDVKLDIWTEEYNLNYLFKYLKSMAESSSIVIMVPT